MAYGTAPGVAAYCRVYTSNGEFTTTTQPTLAAVTNWLTQVSSMADTALGTQGFVTPITDTEAVSVVTMIVEQLVSDLAKAANNTGRFFSENSLKSGVSFWKKIAEDLNGWAEMYAPGLEELGAARGDSNLMSMGYRSEDEAGDEIDPIFQRKAFGNTFQNWDE